MAWIPLAIGAATQIGTSIYDRYKAGKDNTGGLPAYIPKSDSWVGEGEAWATQSGQQAKNILGDTSSQNPFIGDARDQQNQMRDQYLAGLAQSKARAEGQDSVVGAQSLVERDKAQRAFQSQLATMGGQGYYSPAAMRSAQNQSAGFQQHIASQTAAAMAAERQANLEAYLKQIAAGRAQDQNLMGQELEQERQRQAFLLGSHGAAQGWVGLEHQRQAGNAMRSSQNQQFLANLYAAAKGQQQAQANYQQQRSDNQMMGGLNAISQAAAAVSNSGGRSGGSNDDSGYDRWWEG